MQPASMAGLKLPVFRAGLNKVVPVCRIFRFFVLLQLVVHSSDLMAQRSSAEKIHSISLNTRYLQVKDAFNYGLVFHGLNLGVRYTYEWASDRNTVLYAPDFALGANFKKGIGIAIHFRPVDLFYGINVRGGRGKSFTAGPYLSTNYQWHAYPELQSGPMFWYSSLEAGPRVRLSIPFKGKLFQVKISNSLAGFSSRPEPSTEKTFYSTTFTDFFSNAHSNLTFGSWGRFNHTALEVEMVHAKDKRLSVAYEFEYFGYYAAPRYALLLHSVNLTWKIGKK